MCLAKWIHNVHHFPKIVLLCQRRGLVIGGIGDGGGHGGYKSTCVLWNRRNQPWPLGILVCHIKINVMLVINDWHLWMFFLQNIVELTILSLWCPSHIPMWEKKRYYKISKAPVAISQDVNMRVILNYCSVFTL